MIVFLFVAVWIKDSVERENQDNLIDKYKAEFESKLATENFKESKEISLVYSPYRQPSYVFKIDTTSNRLALCNYLDNDLKIISFESLLDCEVIEDNSTIRYGGISRAVVGGMIAGNTGAIIGASTSKSKTVTSNLSIKIIISDTTNPLILIPLITSDTNRNGEKYKHLLNIAQEVHSTIISIIKTSNSSFASNDTDFSNFSKQLKALAELNKSGIISDEEFQEKKADLLSKM